MGKLVLGIIAIVFLQIAFLVYTAINGRDNIRAGIAEKPDAPRSSTRITRAENIPSPEVIPEASPTVSNAGPDRLGSKVRPSISQRPDIARIRRFDPNRLENRNAARTREQNLRVRGPYGYTENSRVIRTSAVGMIPQGHTMVLVDYLSSTTSRYKSRESVTP